LSPKDRTRLFTLFAPITVPAYIVFLAFANLLGFAYYIVVEATLSPFLKRPISLTKKQMALLAVPVLLLAPAATLAQLVVWAVRLMGRGMCGLGRWQTGIRRTGPAFGIGLAWLLAAFWISAACFNAVVALNWLSPILGKPLHGEKQLVEHLTRFKTLGDMPADMQARRTALIADIDRLGESIHPNAARLRERLADNEWPFDRLPQPVLWRLADVPWFYYPAEQSEDGSAHSAMLLGALFFAWVVLIRWPGLFGMVRGDIARSALYVIRIGAALAGVFALVTWKPMTAYYGFFFNADDFAPFWFKLVSPAAWFGVSFTNFTRPEWYLLNIGVGLAVLGVATFVWWLAWRIGPFLGWPRFYVAFIASRLLQKKRIAFFSVGAVTLCVAMMIIVISVMGGFVDNIKIKAHGLLGDLVMDGGLQGFPYYDEFIRSIKSLPVPTNAELKLPVEECAAALAKRVATAPPTDRLVLEATPLIHTYGVLQFPNTKRTFAVAVWGIRQKEYVRVNQFGRDLYYGNRFGFGDVSSPTSQPVFGFDAHDMAVLPPEMEKRYRDYLAGLSEEDRKAEIERFSRKPGEMYFGPGVFKMASKEPTAPGYEGKALPGVILGRDTVFNRLPSGEYARGRDYPIGSPCYLTMLPITRGGDISPEPPPKPIFRYVDDSRTGIHEIDSRNVYVDFDELQRLLTMGPAERADDEETPLSMPAEGAATSKPAKRMAPARARQIQIKLTGTLGDDRERLGRVKALLERHWAAFCDAQPLDPLESRMVAQVEIHTWEEMQQGFISAVEKEKVLVVIMFGVISIVAVFLILAIFHMIVHEKTRDIGILKSIGASAEGVTSVFLAYAAAIGLVGCIIGSILGVQFVDHINDIQNFLARLNPDWRVWSPDTYSFDQIPSAWKWSEVIFISILSICSSVLGAAIPAMRAGKTWPVESLRYE